MTDERWSDIGARVRESRQASGISQTELADRLDLERSMLAKVETGDRKLNAHELFRLAETTGFPMEHFLHAPPAVLSRRAAPLAEPDSPATRDAYRMEVELTAWLRDVRQLTDELGLLCTPARPLLYTQLTGKAVTGREGAREAALWTREQVAADLAPLGSLADVCEQAGQYVCVTDIPGEGVSLVDGRVGAAVVSAQRVPGRRRATAAHELGHFVLGDEYSSDLGVNASRDEREDVVEAFAAELLLPTDAVRASHEPGETAVRPLLVRLAAKYRTSWSLAVHQAVRAGVADAKQRNRLLAQAPTKAEFLDALGWTPEPDFDAVRVPPRYAQAVMRAYRQGWVTGIRAVALMRDQTTLEDLPVLEDPAP